MLASIVERQLQELPYVQAELRRNASAVLRITEPRPHRRDANGRDWDIDVFECGDIDAGACDADFRVIVDRLRDRYDLL
jgi:hypothetical protein